MIGNTGFFIISPDGISIGSLRDTNVGTVNLIEKQKKALLDRVFLGETVLIPPILSDVPLKAGEGNSSALTRTMFIAGPLHNQAGDKIIAALAMRLDPSEDFTRIAQLGQIGLSGETYAIDKGGRLITESRFDEDLRRVGLIGKNENAILNILIRDPGGNLMEGYPLPSNRENLPLTFMAAEAIAGNNGSNIKGYRDYRGVPVMGAWIWDDNLGFGMATEIDIDEALASYRSTRNTILIVLGITVLVSIILTGLSIWIGRSANRSLHKARDDLEDRIEERTQDLQDSEERTRAIINSTSDGVVVIDEHGLVESMSPAAEKIFGFSAAEVIGRNVRILMPQSFQADHDAKLARYRESGDARIVGTNREIVGKRKDGTEFPMDLAIGEAWVKDGRIFVGVMRDITERKQAEAELAEKEAQISTALSGMSGGLFMIDKDLNLKVINEKFLEWFEIPESIAYPGAPLVDILRVRAERGDYGPGDPDAQIEERLQEYRDRVITRTEDHVANGRILEVLRTPTDDGGMVIACNDITKSKQAEEKMRNNLDELEKFNRLAVGRELRMIDLKQEINDLLKKQGKYPEYEIVE